MFRFPTPDNTTFVMIDMQQKLLPAMHHSDVVAARMALLLDGLKALGVPMVVTEQYPAGLGPTVPELAERLPEKTPVLAKTEFSCFGAKGFDAALDLAARPVLILAGIEAHVCVQQTALDALNRGFQVLLPFDGVSSRREAEVETALRNLGQLGAGIYSVEALLFLLLRGAGHPTFKTISKLVR